MYQQQATNDVASAFEVRDVANVRRALDTAVTDGEWSPWAVVMRVMHDLTVHGVREKFGGEADLNAAAECARDLLAALGVQPGA